MHFNQFPTLASSAPTGIRSEKKAHVRDLLANLHDDDIALVYMAPCRIAAEQRPVQMMAGRRASRQVVSDGMRRVACGCTGRRRSAIICMSTPDVCTGVEGCAGWFTKKMFARFLLPKSNAIEMKRKKNDLAKKRATHHMRRSYATTPILTLQKKGNDQIRMKRLEKLADTMPGHDLLLVLPRKCPTANLHAR